MGVGEFTSGLHSDKLNRRSINLRHPNRLIYGTVINRGIAHEHER